MKLYSEFFNKKKIKHKNNQCFQIMNDLNINIVIYQKYT